MFQYTYLQQMKIILIQQLNNILNNKFAKQFIAKHCCELWSNLYIRTVDISCYHQ